HSHLRSENAKSPKAGCGNHYKLTPEKPPRHLHALSWVRESKTGKEDHRPGPANRCPFRNRAHSTQKMTPPEHPGGASTKQKNRRNRRLGIWLPGLDSNQQPLG